MWGFSERARGCEVADVALSDANVWSIRGIAKYPGGWEPYEYEW